MTTKTTKWAPKPKDSGTFSIWLCLPCGMFAIAHRWPGSYDPETDPRDIMVRARKRKYLDRLRASFLPELGKDEGRAGQGTDYGHRAFVRSEDLARSMARMALAIDSPGFKDHAEDADLHNAYMAMWHAAVRLDDNSPYWKPKPATQAGPTWFRHRPQDCLKFGSHFWDHPDGSATCRDCGAKRTRLRNGGYRFSHPRGAVRLTDQWGKPLSVRKAA